MENININNELDNEELAKEYLKDELKRIKELNEELIRKYEKSRVYHQRIKLGDAYKVNPFVMENGKMILGVNRTIQKKFNGSSEDVLVNVNTGELKGTTAVIRNEEVDSSTFVKLYVNSLPEFMSLGKAGQKLAQYVLTFLKPNQDEVYLYIPEVCEFCGWKARNQFYTALKELYSKELLAPSERSGMYFINPNHFYNGDRLLLIKNYIKKGSGQLELFKEIE